MAPIIMSCADDVGERQTRLRASSALSRQEIYDTRLAHSRSSGECQVNSTARPGRPLHCECRLFRGRCAGGDSGMAGDDHARAAHHPACPFRRSQNRTSACQSRAAKRSDCQRGVTPRGGDTARAGDALTDPVTVAIAAVSLIVLLTTELDTLWLILRSSPLIRAAFSFGRKDFERNLITTSSQGLRPAELLRSASLALDLQEPIKQIEQLFHRARLRQRLAIEP